LLTGPLIITPFKRPNSHEFRALAGRNRWYTAVSQISAGFSGMPCFTGFSKRPQRPDGNPSLSANGFYSASQASIFLDNTAPLGWAFPCLACDLLRQRHANREARIHRKREAGLDGEHRGKSAGPRPPVRARGAGEGKHSQRIGGGVVRQAEAAIRSADLNAIAAPRQRGAADGRQQRSQRAGGLR
jgi:hypothetical protein